MKRTLAVDHGTVRIGLAISDPMGITARGLPLLAATGRDSEDAAAIAEIAAREGAEQILVGMPRTLDDREGPAAQRVHRFMEVLALATDLPILEWDERLTSAEADRVVRATGPRLSARRRRERVNTVAAQILLRAFLEFQRGAAERVDNSGDNG